MGSRDITQPGPQNRDLSRGESTNEVSIEVLCVMGSRDITQPGPQNRDLSRGESTNEVSIEVLCVMRSRDTQLGQGISMIFS